MKVDLSADREKTEKILQLMENDQPFSATEPPGKEESPGNTGKTDHIMVVGVQINRAADIYPFETNSLDLHVGSSVIINIDGSTAFGHVITKPTARTPSDVFPDGKIQKIIRIADSRDIAELERAKSKEPPAFAFCLELIKNLELDMKLVQVRYHFGSKKAIFYFTAAGRVDFRQLVKDLVVKYRIRIELRQIGVRDETRLSGGIGTCGREFCCCSFARRFPAVSIKMGKNQGLSLNPAKISGMCGRLLCCLSYEHSVYKELGQKIPRPGKRCQFEGRIGKILNVNVLAKRALLLLEDGGVTTVSTDKLVPLARDARGQIRETKNVDTYEERFLTELRSEFADLDILPFIEFDSDSDK